MLKCALKRIVKKCFKMLIRNHSTIQESKVERLSVDPLNKKMETEGKSNKTTQNVSKINLNVREKCSLVLKAAIRDGKC